jgi:two-component system, chemotaxis family, protein-glutamate methylesterase/glutaminase
LSTRLLASVYVVLHLPRSGPHALPAILSRAGPLPAVGAVDNMFGQTGVIYVAPPDHHLVLVPDGRMRLTQDIAVRGHRPSVDVLFRSAAQARGERAIAVVLSGAGSDGAAGLAAVIEAGGAGIVQDPSDAQHPSMPEQALAVAPAAWVCRGDAIGDMINDLVTASGETLRREHGG